MNRIGIVFLGLAMIASFGARDVFADDVAPEKIKEISDKQDKILQLLEELKTELNIVKIRVSSR